MDIAVKHISLRLALAGLGNVGRNFLRLMQSQRDVLRDAYGLDLVLVGAADSRHVVAHADGIDPVALLGAKEHEMDLREFIETRHGASLPTINDLVTATDADILLEATPANFQHGQPGLDLVRIALHKDMSVVLANKGPLALAYQELLSAPGGGTSSKRSEREEGPRARAKGRRLSGSPPVSVARCPQSTWVYAIWPASASPELRQQ
jgi:homoserine dehydrogenase